MTDAEIDLVYTWVGADAAWLEQKQRYAQQEVTEENSEYAGGAVRYQDNGELKYSIQTVYRYLPWLRRIFVTYAGAPPVLPPHPKVTLISQLDLVPAELAPTYQIDVISAFLHRIPDLAECYLCSDDDFFFAAPHTPADFFSQRRLRVGVSDRFAVVSGSYGPRYMHAYYAQEANSVRALQQRWSEGSTNIGVGASRLRRWLNNPRMQRRARQLGLPLLNCPAHVTQPYRRSYWTAFHQVFQAEMQALCARRFRSEHGYLTTFMYHHFMRNLGMCDFYWEPRAGYLERSQLTAEWSLFRHALLHGRFTRFCLNDDAVSADDGWPDFIRMLMAGRGYHDE